MRVADIRVGDNQITCTVKRSGVNGRVDNSIKSFLKKNTGSGVNTRACWHEPIKKAALIKL